MDVEQDEESSILDLPGVEEIGSVHEPISSPSQPTSNEKKRPNAKAKPSGSGMTFFMDESADDMDQYEVDESLNDPVASDEIIRKSLKHQTAMDVESSDQLQKELTEKYMAGQISFKDYIHQLDMDEDDDDDDEDEEEEDVKDEKEASKNMDDTFAESSDEEWKPSSSSSKKAKQRKKAMEDFTKDLKATTKQQLGRKLPRLGVQRGKRKRLNPTLQGLMGEANLRFARGDVENAIKMCMEVIRQDPGAPEPFQTLSTLYEETGEFEKSLQFAMIGAHLAPPDAEEWERLANMSLELGDIRQAASCYKKAIDADSSNIKLHITRCNLLEEIDEKKKALGGYRRLLLCLKPHQGFECLEASREVARLLHERGNIEAAKSTIESAMAKNEAHVQPEHVNLLLELLITLSEFKEALEVLCKRAHAKFESKAAAGQVAEMEPEEQLQVFTKASLPPDTPLDIKAKLAVVLLNLKATHLVQPLSEPLLACHTSEYGDLMLDVSEAYMGQKCFPEALVFLEKLVDDDEYGKAAVWLRFAEFLFETGKLEEAERAYAKVVEMAPHHYEARRSLSIILRRLGRTDEALHTLTQDEEAELLNPTLLYERCRLLHSEGQKDEFVKKTKLLLSRHFVELQSREEVYAIASSKRMSKKNKGLNEVRAMSRLYDHEDVDSTTSGPSFESDSKVKAGDEFDLMRKACDVLFEQKRFAEMQRLTFSALGSNFFNKHPDIIRECECLCLFSAFFNKDALFAFNYAREFIVKDVNNAKLWNLFNTIITSNTEDTRHNKFLMRLTTRHPDNVPMGILNGHNTLLSGTYKYSLGEYMNVFKVDRRNPIIPLMLGITFVHMACQKFSARKHSLVIQACAFLHSYVRLRGECQEAYYNLGRAMHQLGLFPAAMHYYKRVLDCEPPIGDEGFNLSMEAAFNLSLIYRNSGSHDLARMIVQKHVVI